MSWVTNIILLCELVDTDLLSSAAPHEPALPDAVMSDPISQLNDWLENTVDERLIDVGSLLTGYGKGFESGCYAGAFNYLDIEAFLAYAATLPWKCRAAVQILIKDQEAQIFSLYTL